MPGSVATFATWSTARSSTALCMRSSEANTTPGTRIPSTVPTGIRHTNGSTRSGSIEPSLHVEVDRDLRPAVLLRVHSQLVVGGGFHGGSVGLALERRELHLPHGRGVLHPVDPDGGEGRFLRLVQEQQLVQERD